MRLADPYRDIYAFILQNGRWNNAKRNLKPEFISSNELKYSSLSDKTAFNGGNEFRYFDIRSTRYSRNMLKKSISLLPTIMFILSPLRTGNSNPISTGRISTANIILRSRSRRIRIPMLIMSMFILHCHQEICSKEAECMFPVH